MFERPPEFGSAGNHIPGGYVSSRGTAHRGIDWKESPIAARAIRCPVCRTAVPADVLGAVGGACPGCQRPLDAGARHALAVAQTRRWADQAAARGDHAEALAWLKTVEAVGERLSADDEDKRAQWGSALRERSGDREEEVGRVD